jgi:hypothetical protein
MIRAAILCALASPVAAQDSVQVGPADAILGVTTVTLQPTDAPGAVAEVVFSNSQVNVPRDQVQYVLVMGDLTAGVSFALNVDPLGSDQITVNVPEGYIASPETITVQENASGTVFIYSADGVGM